MPIVKGVVTQGGADTFTADTIDTNLAIDGKVGWAITGFKTFWTNGYSLGVIDLTLSGVLSTQATVTTMDQTVEIIRTNYAIQNTAGVAVAFPLQQIQVAEMFEPRLTVQPNLYVHASSAGSGQANVLYYEIQYEIVRLSELEVMRLLVGGV